MKRDQNPYFRIKLSYYLICQKLALSFSYTEDLSDNSLPLENVVSF
jgi:hypothetical protein